MAGKTAAQLRTRVRQLCNVENSQVVTDPEVDECVIDAVGDLYDELVAVYEYYFQSTFAFTLSSSNAVALPLDFYKDNGVDLNPGRNAITIHRGGSFLQRNAGLRTYLINGQTLTIGPPTAFAGSYALYYTPMCHVFDADFTVRCATTSAIPAANGGGPTGPGHTITANANGALPAQDGVTLVVGDRVLVTAEDEPFEGLQATDFGIYVVTSLGSGGTKWQFVRATDFDQASPTEARAGAIVKATEGSTNANVPYVLSSFSGAVDIVPQTWSVATLPQALAPFSEYVQLAAAISVFDKRSMDSGGLPQRFAAQKLRVRTMASNRTEEPGQVPLTRGPGGTGGFWEDPPPW